MIDPGLLEPARAWAASVTEVSQVAGVRRRATALGRRQGFGETREGELALIVTEAATNLVKHGREGQIVVTPLEARGVLGLEMLALDRGAGMENVQECLVDGFSTSGTRGTGLGAIRRLADDFDVHSAPGQGTALLARLWAADRPRLGPGERPPPLEIGGVCLPISGEDVSGDAWAFSSHAAEPRVFMVDGLGHGPLAAEAAAAAVAAFLAHATLPLVRVLEAVHQALRSTRGAVVGIAELDAGRGVILFAGAGNIAGAVSVHGRQKNLVSLSGTMGHVIPSLREFSYDWPAEALLILHSDGLGTKWSIDDYRGLSGRDPSLVAGVLYRDHARGRDDVTVVVARRKAA